MSNDHYVPQLYFRGFSPDSSDGGANNKVRGNIRLINLASRRYVPIASIAGQCKKAGFHDYKPGLEAALGDLEGLQRQRSGVGRGTLELIHQFERILPLKFCVSGVRIKRNMSRIPLQDRVAMGRPKPTIGIQPGKEPDFTRYSVRRSFSD
jgi:hypothetical protein